MPLLEKIQKLCISNKENKCAWLPTVESALNGVEKHKAQYHAGIIT